MKHDPRAPQGGARSIRARRADAGLLAALLAAMTVLAAGYARATPPFEAPDAGGHFGYIAWLREHPGVPTLDFGTAGASHELIQQPPLYYALSAAVIGRRPLTPTLALYLVNPLYGDLGYRVTATPPVVPPGSLTPLRLAIAVSLVGGLLSVAGTWALGRALWPASRGLALTAAAAVALNPQFIAASSSVTNDAWAAATFAWSVWAALRAARSTTRVATWAGVGALVGCAALTKYGNLAVLALVVPLWIGWARRVGRRAGVVGAAGCALSAGVVAGWWFVVETIRYGAPIPLERMLEIVPGLARDEPVRIVRLLHEAAWLPRSYWGVFGHGVVAPDRYFDVVWALCLAALAGLAVLALRAARRREARAELRPVWLPLAWFGVVLAALLGWMRLVVFANQGRLLFPAAPAFALLLALGWANLLPRRRRAVARGAAVVALGALALWGQRVLADAYALPSPSARAPQRAIVADFDGGMRLVGVDLPQGASAVGGGTLPVTLHFTTRWEIGAFFPMFLHLTDVEDRRLADFDGVNAGGRHPTRQWVPGVTFADHHVLDVTAVETDTLAILSVGFYDRATHARRVVHDASDRPIGDRLVIGPVRVQRERPGAAFAGTPLAEWRNGIVLASADVAMVDSAPREVRTEWRTRLALHGEYTVFVQLLDRAGTLVAQVDRRPRGGEWPTSTWVPGYAVPDVYRFDRGAPTWDTLIIGFYDGTGERLPLAGAVDTAPREHVLRRR